ncbi:MAG: biotin-dependent carboxyltransferase family protein [Bacillota bacterium]
MQKILVKNGGPLTTVQDLGRFGYQKFGMPTAGAMDKFSYKIANLLVENQEDEAVLEYTLKGPNLKFEKDAIIAVTGAESLVKLNGKKIKMWKSHYIEKGSTLEISSTEKGLRGYIAFKSGFDLPEIMGSKSTYLRGNLGGYEGRKLKSGDVLEISEKVFREDYNFKSLEKKYRPDFSQRNIRVIMGPQDDCFSKEGISKFLKGEFKVGSQADRMGYRLEGPKIEHKDGADIITDGIAEGSIQVSGNGKPIIMLADSQTTGGYTKIATVITNDIDIVSQKKPGDLIAFEKIDLKTAQKLIKKRKEIYESIKKHNRKSTKSKHYNIKVNGEKYDVELKEIIQ